MTSLSKLQQEFLQAWFQRGQDFFLTGGGALVGYYGLPRSTRDVDLFTTDSVAFSLATARLQDCCFQIEAVWEALLTSPHFRRFRLQRAEESTLVDLVEDLAPQVFKDKVKRDDGVILDPIEEIAVNKVCALVSRSEPRDFFDLSYLVEQGQDPDLALLRACHKDAGVTAETLVMVLGSMDWGRFAMPGQDVRATVAFYRRWLEQLTLGLLPPQS